MIALFLGALTAATAGNSSASRSIYFSLAIQEQANLSCCVQLQDSLLMPYQLQPLCFGCSAAGLTCAAVRDSSSEGAAGEWGLEGGALVLADGGICCLDDLGALKRDIQQTILEAMEQQSVSVAKAS
ncbi:mcm2 3 5 family DNA-dependent ATPase [Cyclospora cayetanensis]|uniref:Mcm2 3 5 family DNA-dependent ATPase n=1 Tax=Cyclospora cayetanensis TaxID=88456 RepID=A0A1D3D4G0_9EIME|nr:mcm2 3 5 family DNA-dependent ATPase [Cyclospora cayetanensis]